MKFTSAWFIFLDYKRINNADYLTKTSDAFDAPNYVVHLSSKPVISVREQNISFDEFYHKEPLFEFLNCVGV